MDNRNDEKQYYEYIEEAFEFFDTDKDGNLNLTELADTMGAVGLNFKLKDLEARINKYEHQLINFSDFRNLCVENLKKKDDNEDLIDIIKIFDYNEDGKISKDDLKNIFIKIYEKYNNHGDDSLSGLNWNEGMEKNIESIISTACKSSNDGMSYNEFIDFIKSIP